MTTAANIHSTRRRTPHANSTSIASKALSVLLSFALAVGFTPIPAISAYAGTDDAAVSSALDRTSCRVIVKLTREQQEKLAESGEMPAALPQARAVASSSDMYLLEYPSPEEALAQASELAGEFEYAECDFEVMAADDAVGAPPENDDTASADGNATAGTADATGKRPEDGTGKGAAQDEVKTHPKIALIDSGRPVKGDYADARSVIGDKVFDDCGHATKTAQAIRELAPDSEIITIKALDAQGRGSAYYSCAAIYSAIEAKADIIVLPLYGKDPHDSKALGDAISNAHRAGAVVVAAAGNGGEDADTYVPANCQEAIVVGAAAQDGKRIETSNYGEGIDIWAIAESTSIASAKAAGWLAANSDLENPLGSLQSQDGNGLFLKQTADPAQPPQPAETKTGEENQAPPNAGDGTSEEQPPVAAADADSTCVIAKATDGTAKEMLEQEPVLMEFDDVYILEYPSAEQAEAAAADLGQKCVFAEVDRPVEAAAIIADPIPRFTGKLSYAQDIASISTDTETPVSSEEQPQDVLESIEGAPVVWDWDDSGAGEEVESDEPMENDDDDGSDMPKGNGGTTTPPVFVSDNGAGARIALLDSGAPASGNIVEALTMLDGTANDTSQHAAGVLSAIERYAPQAEVISIKVLDRDNRGTISAVYAGIMSAISADADIINLSLVSRATEDSRAIEEAVRCALDEGIVVVASAGNNASDASLFIPACTDGVVTIGACDENGVRLPESNFGDCVDVYAVAASTSLAAGLASGWIASHRNDDGTFRDISDAVDDKDFFTYAKANGASGLSGSDDTEGVEGAAVAYTTEATELRSADMAGNVVSRVNSTVPATSISFKNGGKLPVTQAAVDNGSLVLTASSAVGGGLRTFYEAHAGVDRTGIWLNNPKVDKTINNPFTLKWVSCAKDANGNELDFVLKAKSVYVKQTADTEGVDCHIELVNNFGSYPGLYAYTDGWNRRVGVKMDFEAYFVKTGTSTRVNGSLIFAMADLDQPDKANYWWTFHYSASDAIYTEGFQLTKGFQNKVYLQNTIAQSSTQTWYGPSLIDTSARSSGWIYGTENDNYTNQYRSAAVAVANITGSSASDRYFEFQWTGARCGTQLFTQYDPIKIYDKSDGTTAGTTDQGIISKNVDNSGYNDGAWHSRQNTSYRTTKLGFKGNARYTFTAKPGYRVTKVQVKGLSTTAYDKTITNASLINEGITFCYPANATKGQFPTFQDYQIIVTTAKVADVSATLKVTKALSGYPSNAPDASKQFSFKLAAVSKGSTNAKKESFTAPLPSAKTASRTGAGAASFDAISYTFTGDPADYPITYKYTISETKGSSARVSYDTTAHNVTVTVNYSASNGKMSVSVSGNNPTVTNTYTGTCGVKAKKTNSSGSALSGAVFSVYKTTQTRYADIAKLTPVATMESASNGIAQLAGTTLPADGSVYKVIETKAPTGYSVNTSWVGSFTAVKTSSSVADKLIYDVGTCSNVQKTCGVKATKKNSAGQVVQGAVFSVYQTTQTKYATIAALTPVATMTTDASGVAQLPNTTFLADGLPYKVIETSVPAGYQLNTSWVGSFTASKTADNKKIYDVGTCTDVFKTCGVVVLKTDTAGAALEGAAFAVYRVPAGTDLVNLTKAQFDALADGDGVSSGTKKKICEFASGADGCARSGDTALDTDGSKYVVVELHAPSGYNLNTTFIYGFEAPTSTVNKTVFDAGTCTDTQKTCGVKASKADPSGSPLPGVTFSIYKTIETSYSNISAMIPIATMATDADGVAQVSNTSFAADGSTYKIIETAGPQGYRLNTSWVGSFTAAGASADKTIHDVGTCIDLRTTCGVKVLKTDASTDNGVAGAVFSAVKLTSGQLATFNELPTAADKYAYADSLRSGGEKTLISGADGMAQTSDTAFDLDGASYVVFETSVPHGYALNTEWYYTFVASPSISDRTIIDATGNACPDIPYGGLKVRKVSSLATSIGVPNAEFAVYDVTSLSVEDRKNRASVLALGSSYQKATLISNSQGWAQTPADALEVCDTAGNAKYYAVVETGAAPEYHLNATWVGQVVLAGGAIATCATVTAGDVAGNALLAEFCADAPKNGTVAFQIQKELEGGTLEAGQFTFELEYPDGTTVTATNAADGTVTFPEITFATSDCGYEHDYIVRELDPAQLSGNVEPQIAYDSSPWQISTRVFRLATPLGSQQVVLGKTLAYTQGEDTAGSNAIHLPGDPSITTPAGTLHINYHGNGDVYDNLSGASISEPQLLGGQTYSYSYASNDTQLYGVADYDNGTDWELEKSGCRPTGWWIVDSPDGTMRIHEEESFPDYAQLAISCGHGSDVAAGNDTTIDLYAEWVSIDTPFSSSCFTVANQYPDGFKDVGTITNVYEPRCGASISKTDSATGEAVEGAVFEIVCDPNEPDSKIYDVDGTTLLEHVLITTNARGIAATHAKALVCGKHYQVREISAAEGYILDDQAFHGFVAGLGTEMSAASGRSSHAFTIDTNAESRLLATPTVPQADYDIALIDTAVSESAVSSFVSVLPDCSTHSNAHGDAMVSYIREYAPDARILAIEALDGEGVGSAYSVYAAMMAAIDARVPIINLSMSSLSAPNGELVREAILKAESEGIKVVGAAGNDGQDASNYVPGRICEALIAGACDNSGTIRTSSNYGETVDVYVPAETTSEASARVSGWLVAHSGDGGGALDAAISDGTFYAPSAASSNANPPSKNTPVSSSESLFIAQAVSNTQTALEAGYVYVWYAIYTGNSTKSGYVLDVEGAGTASGTNVQLYQYNGSNAQKWKLSFNTTSNGWNFIPQHATGQRLDIYGGELVTFNNVQIYANNNTGAQAWRLVRTSNAACQAGAFRVYSAGSDTNSQALDVAQASAQSAYANGLKVQINSGGGDFWFPVCTQNLSEIRKAAISGNTAVGSTLTAAIQTTGGSASHLYGANVKYQWKRAGTAISGATSSTYTTTAADAGKAITVTISDGYGIYPGSITSAAKTMASTYQVTFNGNGSTGGSTAAQTISWNTSTALTANGFTRTGYSFAGWNTASNGSGTSYSNKQTVKNIAPLGSTGITLYAKWTPNVYTLTLNNQSATTAGSTAIYEKYNTGIYKESGCTTKMTTSANAITKPARSYTVTYNYNGSGAANTSTTATYTFGGYYTATGGGGTQMISANGYITSNLTTTKYTANTTLYAKWTGGSVTLPTPTRTGYTFGGWYKEAACTNKLQTNNAGGASYAPTAAITAYAKWTPNVYTITLDSQSATSAGTTVIYEKYATGYYKDSSCSTQITTSSNAITVPTRAGYTFGGYYTGENGSGTQYINASGKLTSNAANTHFLAAGTLYAKWQPNIFAITLDDQNADSSGTSTIYEQYELGYYRDAECTNQLTASSNAIIPPTKTGYTFDGYYTEAGGNGTCYIDGNGNLTASASATHFSAAGSLYANWTANSYAIAYTGMDDAQHGANHPATATYNVLFEVSTPTSNSGKTFLGWNITGMDTSQHLIGADTTTEEFASAITETSFKNLRATSGVVTFKATWLGDAWEDGKIYEARHYTDTPLVGATLMKQDAGTGSVLGGATFVIRGAENGALLFDADGHQVESLTLTTAVDGTASTSRHALVHGKTYSIEETSSPAWYENNHSSPTAFVAEKSSGASFYNLGVFADRHLDRVGIKIMKNDAVTGTAVEGAVFEIVGNTAQDSIYNSNDTIVSSMTLTTDGAGKAESYARALLAGRTYKIKEVSAPAGYENDNTSWVEFVAGGANAGGTSASVDGTIFELPPFTDTPHTKATFIKQDADSGIALAGASFTITGAEEGAYLFDSSGNAVQSLTVTAGEDGTASTTEYALVYGKAYSVTETHAPDWYAIDDDSSRTFTAGYSAEPIEKTLSITKTFGECGHELYSEPIEIHYCLGTEVEQCEICDDMQHAVVCLDCGAVKVVSVEAVCEDCGETLEDWEEYIGTWEPADFYHYLNAYDYYQDAHAIINVANPFIFTDTHIDRVGASISKIDAATGEPVEGAEFEIIGDDSQGAFVYDSNGDIVSSIILETGASGVASTHGKALLSGKTYTIREYSAPDGYANDHTTWQEFIAGAPAKAAASREPDTALYWGVENGTLYLADFEDSKHSANGDSALTSSSASDVPWHGDTTITSVIVESTLSPSSTAFWFADSNIASCELYGLDTSHVTDMSSMFAGCSSLISLDVSGFDVNTVTDMSSMFSGCSVLTTIYGYDDWNVEEPLSTSMFQGCSALVGGEGTSYNGVDVSAAYAHLDDGTSGYFTMAEAADGTVLHIGTFADRPLIAARVTKTNSATGSPLGDATFEIEGMSAGAVLYDIDGEAMDEDGTLTITTDQSGSARTHSFALVYGETYMVREAQAPTGYMLDDGEWHEFVAGTTGDDMELLNMDYAAYVVQATRGEDTGIEKTFTSIQKALSYANGLLAQWNIAGATPFTEQNYQEQTITGQSDGLSASISMSEVDKTGVVHDLGIWTDTPATAEVSLKAKKSYLLQTGEDSFEPSSIAPGEFVFGVYADAECAIPIATDSDGHIVTQGGTLLEAVTDPDPDGNVTVEFPAIAYGTDDIGEHVYYIREKEGGKRGIEYDVEAKAVTVSVSYSNMDGSTVLNAEMADVAGIDLPNGSYTVSTAYMGDAIFPPVDENATLAIQDGQGALAFSWPQAVLEDAGIDAQHIGHVFANGEEGQFSTQNGSLHFEIPVTSLNFQTLLELTMDDQHTVYSGTLTIDCENYSGDIIDIPTFTNIRHPIFDTRIYKESASDSSPLSNAKFAIYEITAGLGDSSSPAIPEVFSNAALFASAFTRTSTATKDYLTPDNAALTSAGLSYVTDMTTGSDGFAITENGYFDSGKAYAIVEIEAPTGYLLQDSPYVYLVDDCASNGSYSHTGVGNDAINLDANGDEITQAYTQAWQGWKVVVGSNVATWSDFTFANQPSSTPLGGLSVRKIDANTQQTLDSATFAAYDETEFSTTYAAWKAEHPTEPDSSFVDELMRSGIPDEDIPAGEYYIEPVAFLRSIGNGDYATSERALPYNEDYRVIEFSPPNGYEAPAYDFNAAAQTPYTGSWTATVAAQDDITAIAKSGDNMVFANEKSPEQPQSANAHIQAYKTLTYQNGQDLALQNGEFSFDLLDDNGNVITTSANDEMGKIGFELSYSSTVEGDIGTHTYSIRENIPAAAVAELADGTTTTWGNADETTKADLSLEWISGSIRYDASIYELTVDVEESEEGDHLGVSISYGNDEEGDQGAIWFSNLYLGSVSPALAPGSLVVSKIAEDTSAPLNGAVFQAVGTNGEGTYYAMSAFADLSSEVGIVGDGYAVWYDELPEGTYVVTEIEAPEVDDVRYAVNREWSVTVTVFSGEFADETNDPCEDRVEIPTVLLPLTGGSGTVLFLPLMGALIVTASLILRKKGKLDNVRGKLL